MTGESSNKMQSKFPYTNALINESSPYLQQHAHNPVSWYPWRDETLQKAKEENKLLIISIGYSACHWCHVMERESYSDKAIAHFMNEHFISIKVDREERPDVDQIYMKASQLITGGGGWPLNAFALPDGRPFYAVTYLPQQHWLNLLHQIVNIFRQQPKKLEEQAEALTQGIRGQKLIRQQTDANAEEWKAIYQPLFDQVKKSIDIKNGGLGSAPKFPMPNAWELLLQYYYLTTDEEVLQPVTLTLDQMARGGIYDQLGGGFARYATDAHWRVPHFEKMLYDNGQLVSLYAHAYQVTHKPLYAEVVRETLDFIKREMTHEEGGFYSSINADSEGEEGKFYVWTEEEINELSDNETGKWIRDYYNITTEGNWEHHKNILYRNITDEAFAKKHDIALEKLHSTLQKAKEILLKARSKRIRPTTDDKILTSWNAIMLKGYVNAYRALGDKSDLEAAIKNAKFLEQNMIKKEGGLLRNFQAKTNNNTAIQGLLDDYALLADAFIALYEATFDIHWLKLARQLTDFAIRHFRDPESGLFYYTSDKSQALISRQIDTEDNVIPSSNSVMVNVLYRLGLYYDDQNYTDHSKEMLTQMTPHIPSAVPYFANWARLMGLMAYGVHEIAIMGKNALSKSHEMQKVYLPTSLFLGGEKENLPLLKNKLTGKETVIYVCKNKECKLPVMEVSIALQQIK